MSLKTMKETVEGNKYPGRGIVVGKSADGKSAVCAYFIMGRSENSRNRIFTLTDDGIQTEAYDKEKLTDPSLIIYHPVRRSGSDLIVTNGDQTNTIYDFVEGQSGVEHGFEDALATREYEDDMPNYTPRISGMLNYDGEYTYKLSILKSSNGRPVCNRYFYNYRAEDGIGHFIHTYKCDGNPIPSFYGEPEEVEMPNTAQELADIVWSNLNEDNKVSLFVRAVSLENGEAEEIIINKNK